MNYERWKKVYQDISKDLNIDRNQDEIASEILDMLIGQNLKTYCSVNTFLDLISNRTVFVFGAAPSLDFEVKNNIHRFKQSVLIAADGATSALLKYDLIPDVIISDLDGIVADQINANEKNGILVVHAHGDNVGIVQHTIPRIKGPYFGSIQTDPSKYSFVKNFGGFTDGDRCVFFTDYFHAKKIILVGFDCQAKPGFYSFQKSKKLQMKKKKLAWCQHFLDQFKEPYLTHI